MSWGLPREKIDRARPRPSSASSRRPTAARRPARSAPASASSASSTRTRASTCCSRRWRSWSARAATTSGSTSAAPTSSCSRRRFRKRLKKLLRKSPDTVTLPRQLRPEPASAADGAGRLGRRPLDLVGELAARDPGGVHARPAGAASNIGGMAEKVDDGVNGLQFAVGEPTGPRPRACRGRGHGRASGNAFAPASPRSRAPPRPRNGTWTSTASCSAATHLRGPGDERGHGVTELGPGFVDHAIVVDDDASCSQAGSREWAATHRPASRVGRRGTPGRAHLSDSASGRRGARRGCKRARLRLPRRGPGGGAATPPGCASRRRRRRRGQPARDTRAGPRPGGRARAGLPPPRARQARTATSTPIRPIRPSRGCGADRPRDLRSRRRTRNRCPPAPRSR